MPENITPNRDEDLSDEIHAIFCQLVETEKEIFKTSIVQQKQITTLFSNEFCPNFMALYRYTNSHIRNKCPDENTTKLLDETYEFLIKIRSTHRTNITTTMVYDGIDKFGEYTSRLTKEKVLKIV